MARNIAARRKLGELYEKGEELRFDAEGAVRGPFNEEAQRHGPFEDPCGADEVAVWVTNPHPLQRDMALRDAQAARARAVLAVRRDKESLEYLTALSFLSEMSDDTLVEYVLVSGDDTRRQDAERDVLAQEEWSNISELQDSWRHYAEEPPDDADSDPQYQALLARDAEYGKQIRERQDQLREGDRDSLSLQPRAVVEKKAMESRADLIATQAFMHMYERQMQFYGVRDIDDHKQLFFESAKEMESYPKQVQDAVGEVLAQFLDGSQAKNSPRVASGSTSSEPPVSPETSEASTPQTLSA